MAVLSDILSRVRLELGDQQKNFTFTATGDGVTAAFSTGIKPIELANLYITVAGAPLAYPADYSLEADTGIITFTDIPATGEAIVIQGLQDRYFLDSELTNFVNDAVNQHTYNRTDSFGSQVTISSISPVEEYPVAILAAIEGLWALATDAAFDIDVQAPDGINIPRSERYRQLTGIIQQRWDQYKTLCAQLNIGLWKIEMGTLIRTSRTTNKFVPIYMGQEIDDSRQPERVYISNNLTGRTPIPTSAQTYDIVMYQGDSFSTEFDFPFDVTGLVFTSQIRSYPNSPSLYGTFDVAVTYTSPTLSKVKISLTNSATAYIPVRTFWDLQATSLTDPTYENTFIRGQVFTTQQVTLD